MNLPWYFQLVVIFGGGFAAFPEHEVVKLPRHLDSTRNLDLFPAFTPRHQPSNGFNMFESHVMQVRPRPPQSRSYKPPLKGRRRRFQGGNGKYETVLLPGSVLIQPVLGQGS